MKKEIRTAVYDDRLHLEAYSFANITQPFPKHFHEYYVIGLVEEGERILCCKNCQYTLKKGDILLLNPGDIHACSQQDGGTLDYRGMNISQSVMLDLVEKAIGQRVLPGFWGNVICDEEAADYLYRLHELMMKGSHESKKEEILRQLIALLVEHYSQPFVFAVPEDHEEVERACAFMEAHYAKPINLDQLCRYTAVSKSTLLRAFAGAKGVTPYSYLQNIRIGKARQMLEHGDSLVETALRTGFYDQSHFTNCFNRLIGLAPGVYRKIFQDPKEKIHEK
ncbi:AraC family transcriptional regulator [Allobaculum sp. JKK-2023]|uniref:AraC family transcriptional regulator n=1 Tax=Allobaculum sp. JKK-2023 TaxID=3108943 RepID=UPI002B05FEDE|nr:AraC family transcriptional regulator [Allobaculum sp. JKK-2023]